MTTTPHLALPLLAAAQAQKHVTHNEALLGLDAIVACAVKDKDLAAPPASPAEGDRYIVGPAASGSWAGKAGNVAAWQDGLWRFYAPKAGWIAFVIDETQLYHHNGAGWAPGATAITNLQNLASLGIGAAADAGNPFSARLNAALYAAKPAAEGGTGHVQVKLSKEAAANSASTLFQTTFSGRAECGLVGDDNFRIKTSANGSSWTDALVLAATSGAATFAAGATFGGPVATPPSGASGAGLKLPHGAAPSTPANGDIWTTSAGLFARINGTTEQYARVNGPVFTGAAVMPARGAFHVRRTTDQTGMTAAAYNKVLHDSKLVDTDNWYSTSTNRLQPTEPGKWLLYASIYAPANAMSPQAAMAKNGGNFAAGSFMASGAGTGDMVSNVTAVIELNGSTDYVEAFCFLPSGVTTVRGHSLINTFGGFKIGS